LLRYFISGKLLGFDVIFWAIIEKTPKPCKGEALSNCESWKRDHSFGAHDQRKNFEIENEFGYVKRKSFIKSIWFDKWIKYWLGIHEIEKFDSGISIYERNSFRQIHLHLCKNAFTKWQKVWISIEHWWEFFQIDPYWIPWFESIGRPNI
jgi:hypothetical protein